MTSVPEKGDSLVFTAGYVFMSEDTYVIEVPKGTMAKVVDRIFYNTVGDEVGCHLIIELTIDDDTKLFKIDYTVHKNIVKVVPGGKASKVLYDKKK